MTAGSRSRFGRGTWLRFVLLIAMVAGATAAIRFSPLAEWLTRERLLDGIETLRTHPAAPPAFFALFTLACLIGSPITPLMVAGGAAFGVIEGATLSMAAILTGSALTWLVVRRLGYGFVIDLVGDRLKRVERLISRRGFWSLVRARFIPIPFLIASTSITLLGVPFGRFMTTTALAMTPITVAWSAFASALVETAEGARAAAVRNLVVILLLLIALSFLPPRLVAWRRAQRLRALRGERAKRAETPD